MPRSPCRAFNESSTTAGDPVLVRVEAILLPIWPDLPTPTTTTLPRASTASLISWTAREKLLAQAVAQPLELENFDVQDAFGLLKVVHRCIIVGRGVVTGKKLRASVEGKS